METMKTDDLQKPTQKIDTPQNELVKKKNAFRKEEP
jgi:hypothetical protein